MRVTLSNGTQTELVQAFAKPASSGLAHASAALSASRICGASVAGGGLASSGDVGAPASTVEYSSRLKIDAHPPAATAATATHEKKRAFKTPLRIRSSPDPRQDRSALRTRP